MNTDITILQQIGTKSKYMTWYLSICHNARTRAISKKDAQVKLGYVEGHHIVPKSLGGSNTKSNFAYLSAREHYICHWLLTKFITGALRYKMIHAFNKFHQKQSASKSSYKINSRAHETLKIERAKILSDLLKSNNPMSKPEYRAKCSQPGELNGMFGKVGPNKGKIGELSHLYGKKRPEHSIKMTGENNPSFGKTPPKQTCLWCNKVIDIRNYSRYHGDKCKLRNILE